MKQQDLDANYTTASDDRYDQQQLTDTRKPHITLRHLNKLKKMRAARDLENLVRRDTMELLYGVPSEEAPPGM